MFALNANNYTIQACLVLLDFRHHNPTNEQCNISLRSRAEDSACIVTKDRCIPFWPHAFFNSFYFLLSFPSVIVDPFAEPSLRIQQPLHCLKKVTR